MNALKKFSIGAGFVLAFSAVLSGVIVFEISFLTWMNERYGMFVAIASFVCICAVIFGIINAMSDD